jgi:hypothetical protein
MSPALKRSGDAPGKTSSQVQVGKPQCDASARDLLSQHDGAARIEAIK